MKIAFLPIDNRPVCYTMPKIIAGIDSDIDFSIPPREMLGSLEKSADIEGLFEWLEKIPSQDAIILSLDSIAYGGLIPSRRGRESFEQIKARIEKLEQILRSKNSKIFAFSSIMRISNNNYNEEEKEYWSDYGKKIFEYSFNLCKFGDAKTDVPKDILDDYLQTRKRNFEINKIYLNLQKEGLFDTLVFSKDDCAQFGFNISEANELKNLGGFIKTGADEIPLSLLSGAISDVRKDKLKISPIFLEPDYKDLISNYEDLSIEKSVLSQIELADCIITEAEDSDILLFINNFKNNQGEIVMKRDTEMFKGNFKVVQRPYMIADVRFANGADNNFVTELLKNEIDDRYFYGYSAWNTSANTLGSLICGAKIKFFAKKYNRENFQKLQITRFLDDWGYQANVRQMLKNTDRSKCCELMKHYENEVAKKFDIKNNIEYIYPWNRLFEVEVEFS